MYRHEVFLIQNPLQSVGVVPFPLDQALYVKDKGYPLYIFDEVAPGICVNFWAFHYQKDINKTEGEATKMVREEQPKWLGGWRDLSLLVLSQVFAFVETYEESPKICTTIKQPEPESAYMEQLWVFSGSEDIFIVLGAIGRQMYRCLGQKRYSGVRYF